MWIRKSLFVAVAGLALSAAACGESPTAPSAVQAPRANSEVGGSTVSQEAETTVRGAIQSVSGGQLQVAGRAVMTDANTRVLDRQNAPIPLSSLPVGSQVEIEGRTQPDGSVLAEKIKLEDADDEAPGAAPGAAAQEVEFTGLISSMNPLLVAGRTVMTDGNTRVLDHENAPMALSSLSVGSLVEVEGRSQPDGSVLAEKIKLEDDIDEAPGAAAQEVEFTGLISSMSPLLVAGRTVTTDANTRVLDHENAPMALSSLSVGTLVEVEGTIRADGSVLAEKIKLED